MAKARFGPPVTAAKAKYARGQIVKVGTAYPSYLCTPEGEPLVDGDGHRRMGPSCDVYALVIKDITGWDKSMFFGEATNVYVVRVIPGHTVNEHPVANAYFSAYCLVSEKRMSSGSKEKRMTEAKVYDGERFFVDRVRGMKENIHKDEIEEKSKSNPHTEDR